MNMVLKGGRSDFWAMANVMLPIMESIVISRYLMVRSILLLDEYVFYADATFGSFFITLAWFYVGNGLYVNIDDNIIGVFGVYEVDRHPSVTRSIFEIHLCCQVALFCRRPVVSLQ